MEPITKTKTIGLISVIGVFLLAAPTLMAIKGKPNFEPSVYGDGKAWGTKAAAILKAPTEKNMHSYDGLYVIINGSQGQLPVAEAAPGNRMFNGGRWIVYTTTWTQTGLDYYEGSPPVLMSFADLWMEYMDGNLVFVQGSFEGGPPPYFECPLLPVK